MSEIKQSLLLTLLGGLNTRQCLVAFRHCQPVSHQKQISATITPTSEQCLALCTVYVRALWSVGPGRLRTRSHPPCCLLLFVVVVVYFFPFFCWAALGGVTGLPELSPPYGNFFLSAGCKGEESSCFSEGYSMYRISLL